MENNEEKLAAVSTEDQEQTFPPVRTLVMVLAALYIAMFLVSLVSTLVESGR